jgi:hypothetical protein
MNGEKNSKFTSSSPSHEHSTYKHKRERKLGLKNPNGEIMKEKKTENKNKKQ